MGLPSNGSVSDFQNYMLRDLEERYKDEVELVYPAQLCQRIFHDAAREGITQDFMDSGCDVMWMLDSDVCPPKHILDLLTSHGDKWQVAGAPYPVFMAQPGETHRQVVFTIYRRIPDCPATKKPRIAPADCPSEGTDFLDGIATGCLFIKREVFEKLERPYWEFKYDPITRQPVEGEDIGFCLKMLRLGIKFFVDYSMVCKHYKNNIDLLEMNNYAISYAQKCVNMQHGMFNKQAQLASDKYDKLKETNKQLREALRQTMAMIEQLKRNPSKPLIFK